MSRNGLPYVFAHCVAPAASFPPSQGQKRSRTTHKLTNRDRCMIKRRGKGHNVLRNHIFRVLLLYMRRRQLLDY